MKKIDNNALFRKVNLLMGVIMSIIYMAFGAFLFFIRIPVLKMQHDFQLMVGGLIFLYGIFRAYKVYLKNQEYKEEEDDDEETDAQ